MSRSRDSVQEHGPRLFVVFVSGQEQRDVVASLPASVTVVRDADLRDAVRANVASRSRAVSRSMDELTDELRSAVARRASSEGVHAGLLVERERTRDAADWCDRQPAQDAEDAARIATAAETVDAHSRAVRDANRRLERVLEQRAAAEAALEEARAELETLAAAGDEEPEVRRHMEAASRRLHEVTADHQRCKTDVAQRKAEMWRIEDAVAGGPDAEAQRRDRDPLQAMRAAVNAKFDGVDGTVTVVDREVLEQARAATAEAEAEADRLGQEVARARSAVATLEQELTVRIDESDSRASRHRAAKELESQVSAVERQLGEAESRARATVDDATREMSRAELSLERLRHDVRDRRHRLRQLAALVPGTARPDEQEDPVDHAAVIARSLRAHAEAMQPDVDHAVGAVERDRARIDELEAQLEERRAEVGVVRRQDRSGAVERLAAGALAVVFEDAVAPVGDRDETAVVCSDLLVAEIETPMIVLTSDASIVSWAIEQPADLAVVSGVAGLLEIGTALTDQAANRP